MTANLKLLDEDSTTHLYRQIASFSAMRPILVTIFCGMAIIKGGVNVFLLGLMIFCVIRLVNVFKWLPQVQETISERKPLQMKIYFSKASWGMFSDYKATLFDPRRYDPFNQMFKPKWRLVPGNVKPPVGDAQDCLVYLNRESGKVFAFGTASGALFPKPYLTPWNKIDSAELIQSRQASNVEYAE